MLFSNLYALGTQITFVSDIFRGLSFFLDGIIYSLIPAVFNMIYSLYDVSVLFKDASTLTNLLNRFSNTVYSFIAIYMFFRVAFSLLTMLVDPALIDDKEKGAKKIIANIMLCLVLIVVVPYGFNVAKKIQAKAMQEKWIERVIVGEDFAKENEQYSLGNEFSLSVWGVFFHPVSANSVTQAAYDSLFNDQEATGWGKPWPLAKVAAVLPSVVGVPIVADVFSKLLPGVNNVANYFGAGTYYQLSYVCILSTIIGCYVLWTFIKLMIDVAYRSIKFFALEMLSPIAIVSYIEPSSAKKGLFSKWLSETVKTYLSLFIRVFVFAMCSVLLRAFALSEIDMSEGGFVKLFYILALIAFVKNAPKFIDGLFGTTLSKDSDTKFASDMLKGAMGGAAVATTGAIGGAFAAKKTGQNVLKGALSGGWTGATKGYNAAKKGNIVGVVTAGFDTYSASKKKYGYEFDKQYERDLAAMEKHVSEGKTAKNNAIAAAEAQDRQAIKNEFNRTGMVARKVNGYDVRYSNLIGDADAEGVYKKYAATVAENSIIPGISEEGLRIYNNAAQKKMYSALSEMQASRANSAFEQKYSAFLQKDSIGKEQDIVELFNAENARRSASGETTYANWREMYADISGGSASTITMDDAIKVALDQEIKVKTGHTTSEWSNIAGKEKGDAEAASAEVKRHESSSQGKRDKRQKELYTAAKGKVEAQGYRNP